MQRNTNGCLFWTQCSFSVPNVMAIFRREPFNRGKNRDFLPISGFGIDDAGASSTFRLWSKVIAQCGSICLWHQMDDEMLCISESCLWQQACMGTPKRTEQNSIVYIGKSEAEVTNTKRLHFRYCTVETNFRQIWSIARPLCDSRATSVVKHENRVQMHLCRQSLRSHNQHRLPTKCLQRERFVLSNVSFCRFCCWGRNVLTVKQFRNYPERFAWFGTCIFGTHYNLLMGVYTKVLSCC